MICIYSKYTRAYNAGTLNTAKKVNQHQENHISILKSNKCTLKEINRIHWLILKCYLKPWFFPVSSDGQVLLPKPEMYTVTALNCFQGDTDYFHLN